MVVEQWKYYNHAAIPLCAPHEEPDLKPIETGDIWKMDGAPLLARWTTDFDCGYETNWWYVIKDTPFDINALKAKRRYEINKGNKNFLIKEINPAQWAEKIFEVAVAAYATYPKAYRPNLVYDQFISEVKNWKFFKVYGAFSVKDDAFCGYACLKKQGKHIDFCMLKAIPAYEKSGLNAAIVNQILVDHNAFLNDGGYICDGARSVQHETAFQDYLEKYFGFRKAYCKLHILYKPIVGLLLKVGYPFRNLLNKLNGIGAIHKISALLKMEEINRTKN